VFSTAVYDYKRDRMLVFGGNAGINNYNEVWSLSLAGAPAWTLLAPTGTPPQGREYHVAIYDGPRDRMVVYGGYNSGVYLTDLWALNLASGPTWSALPEVGYPLPQAGFSAIYDPVRDRMLLFGGFYSSGSYNIVWTLSLTGTPTWGSLSPAGIAPSGRYAQAVAYDRNTDRMMVLAGTDGYLRNDVWSLYWGTPLLDATPAPPVTRLSLAAPWPNPSRGTSTIEFALPTAARVRLAIFDLAGREVRQLEDAPFGPGRYSRSWDGMDAAGNAAPSGVYFVRLEAPGASLHAKVVRLR
jgi:hypothetical protein